MKKTAINLSNYELLVLSREIRKSVFEICKNANSGHIGGCSGAVELLTTLYFGGILQYYSESPFGIERDHVMVRGHLGPLRYKIFSLLGYLHESELGGYRKYGSRLPGHEDHLETPGVDITPSGSLGMILSYGVGSAYAAKKERLIHKTYVFLGDGEEQEGNISEAARHAAHMRLNNLTVVIDKNNKQLSNPTADTDSSDLLRIWQGYGWEVLAMEDGHDIAAIREAYQTASALAEKSNKPVVIIANTDKGRGLDGCKEHFSGYHTISTCSPAVVESAIEKIRLGSGSMDEPLIHIRRNILHQGQGIVGATTRRASFKPVKLNIKPFSATPPNPDSCQMDYFYILGEMVAREEVKIDPMFFLTADVTRQDHVDLLKLERFCTFLNVGIREQHSIAMAHGLSLTLPQSRILVNSFDAFTYRSIDQVNAAVQGQGSMVIIGDISGLTNSKNGRTHQTSGQPGALLMMPGITILEPWSVSDTFNCLNWAIGESRGVVFIRVYNANIPIGFPTVTGNINWYVVHEPPSDPDLAVVASGLTVNSSLEAARVLEREGVMVRVINLINHKGLDESFARAIPDRKPTLTVYNGYAGVLQMNVSGLLLDKGLNIPSKVIGLGFDIGTTGDTDDLLRAYGIDADGIVRTVKEKIL